MSNMSRDTSWSTCFSLLHFDAVMNLYTRKFNDLCSLDHYHDGEDITLLHAPKIPFLPKMDMSHPAIAPSAWSLIPSWNILKGLNRSVASCPKTLFLFLFSLFLPSLPTWQPIRFLFTQFQSAWLMLKDAQSLLFLHWSNIALCGKKVLTNLISSLAM